MKTKKGIGALGWILIILILIAIGIGVYFWISGNSSQIVPVENISTSVLQPPTLPSG